MKVCPFTGVVYVPTACRSVHQARLLMMTAGVVYMPDIFGEIR